MLYTECMCPSKFIWWNLISNVMEFGGEVNGRWFGYEGRALIKGIYVLIKEAPESSLTLSMVSGHSKKTAIHRLGSRSSVHFSSVKSLSRVRLFVTPWTAASQASLSTTNSWRLPKIMSIESVIPSNHFILCCPLLLLPSIFPSIRVFSNESALCIRWPKYWSFSISPSNEYSGLISFRIEWFDLLVVQGTLKSLLQHHSSKASIVWHSAFFIVQLTSMHDYQKNHRFD